MATTDIFELTAELRDNGGKAATRRLRRLDKVPAIVYGAHKEPNAIVLAQKDVLKTLSQEAAYSHILTLKIDGTKEKVILKALQRHETKPRILHMDFLRISATEKLTMSVPLHLVGEEECPGLQKEGGILSRSMADIEIRCLPAHLPEFIEIDISTLKLDESLHLSDLKLPEGVELTLPKLDEATNLPVVSIHLPRVSQEDIEAEAAEAALAAEAAAGSAETTGEGAPKKVESTSASDQETDSDEVEKE